jgi:hypothetical protein
MSRRSIERIIAPSERVCAAAIGGSAANVMAYDQAKKFSRHPERFGTGTPEGIRVGGLQQLQRRRLAGGGHGLRDPG